MKKVLRCPRCNHLHKSPRTICKNCGVDMTTFVRVVSTTPVDLPERKEILQKEISRLSKQGFAVTMHTDTTAQMVKPKRFSVGAAIVGLLLFGVGLLIYFVIFAMQKSETIFIEVDEFGGINYI